MKKRTRRRDHLFSDYRSRIETNESLIAALAGQEGCAEPILAASKSLSAMSDKLAVPVIANAYSRYARVVELSSRLLSWVDAIKSCEVDADRYLRKAKLLAKELLKDNDAVLTAPQIVSLATAVQGVTDVDEVPKLLGMSLTVPLPIPLSAIPPRSAGWSPKSTATPKLP